MRAVELRQKASRKLAAAEEKRLGGTAKADKFAPGQRPITSDYVNSNPRASHRIRA